ncbi:MAG: hypothetical protein OHK0019_11870 [Saprospiraceae bacterium]
MIKTDTASITQISIDRITHSQLILERTDMGWAVTEMGRTVTAQPELVAPMLEALANTHLIRAVKTNRLDTGFFDSRRLTVTVYQGNEVVRKFNIGSELLENSRPATYLYLHDHNMIYVAENHLRRIFLKVLDDFRMKKVADFYPHEVRKIIFGWMEKEGPNTQYPIVKNDSTGKWEPLGGAPREISEDSIQAWLSLFSRLNDAPFADYFDESRARETLLSQIEIGLSYPDSLVFRLYYVKPPDLPEEISTAKIKTLPAYVLHSSQNPSNFFAPPDTHLLRQIFFMFKPPTDTTIVPKWKERKK